MELNHTQWQAVSDSKVSSAGLNIVIKVKFPINMII